MKWLASFRVVFPFVAFVSLLVMMRLSTLIVTAFSGASAVKGQYGLPTSLADLALKKVLHDAAPIFGIYVYNQTNTSNWMKSYPDSTPITHMNIPGTHDSATWNYSIATQQALLHVTNLAGIAEPVPEYYRTNALPLVAMLNMGIRAFDLRFAFDVTNSTIVFWHGHALQSETATLDDVLFGFYQWLTDHPSEAVFLSFQYEGSTTPYAQNNAELQMAMYQTLTSPWAKVYIKQTHDVLGNLGDARGKITLFRRFDLSALPASYEASLPGLHFSPSLWTDNGPDITLHYAANGTAYIEDYYQPLTPQGSNASLNIQWKYNATVAHIEKAISSYPDSLFWTFASSTNVGNTPPDTPIIQALGNGSLTPEGGVNQKLLSYLKGLQKGSRVGIVMFDFFETPAGLVDALLAL